MRHNPLMQLMAQSLKDGEPGGEALPALEAQDDLLDSFLGEFTTNAAKFKVSDRVVRNRLGKIRMFHPREGQAARVSQVFDRPMLDESGYFAHGEIAVVMEKGEVVAFSSDFRYYDRAE